MCNLRCPSCVIGDSNRKDLRPVKARNMMTPETLGQILDQAKREMPAIEGVGFFNWTEPLLHPRIAALIGEVSSRNIRCWVLSNLNVLRDPDALLAAGPHEIVVSVSGFTQEIYERGHKGGDIEIVKHNMRRLSDAAAKYVTLGNRTWLRLTYHRYVDNADDERLMEEYAVSLGYAFSPCWAYVTSVERVLDIHLRRAEFPEDSDLLNRLALPMREAMRIVGEKPATACPHIDGRLVLDANADVYLCCASSGNPTNIISNFVASSLAELPRAKTTHPLYGPCMQHSVMTYFDRASVDDTEFSAIADARRAARAERALATEER
jgi:wyosine [tRNA(Phe)-imidazoG37] synthetase (radical SAM superfamily)